MSAAALIQYPTFRFMSERYNKYYFYGNMFIVSHMILGQIVSDTYIAISYLYSDDMLLHLIPSLPLKHKEMTRKAHACRVTLV